MINLVLYLLSLNFVSNTNNSNFTNFFDYSGEGSGDNYNLPTSIPYIDGEDDNIFNNNINFVDDNIYGEDDNINHNTGLVDLAALKDETSIRNEIFEDYSNISIPVLNNSHNVLLKFGIQIESLEYFDQVGENIKFNMLITQSWNDEFLRWSIGNDDEDEDEDIGESIGETTNDGDDFYYNNDEYYYNDDYYDDDDYYNVENDNPSVISVFAYQVWKPDLELYNAAEKPTIYDKNGAVKLFYNGNILYIRPTKYSFSCKLNLNDFPYDTQVCSMTFGSWKYSKNTLDLRPFNENDDFKNISINDDFSHNEWNIVDVNVTHTDVEYLCCPGDYYPNSVFTITLERNPTKYTVVIIMTVFITIGDFIVLLLPPDNYRRTFILVFVPLTLIWLQIYIATKIPVIEYSTLMEKILFGCFIINIFNAFESGIIFVLIKKLKNKNELNFKNIKNSLLKRISIINYVFVDYYEKNTVNKKIEYLKNFDNFYRAFMIIFFAGYIGSLVPSN